MRSCDVRIELDLDLTTGSHVAPEIRPDLFPSTVFHLAVVHKIPKAVVGRSDHTVPRDAWLEFSANFGFGTCSSWSSGVPPSDKCPPSSDAPTNRSKARRPFDDHEYWHVCGDVCEALEHLVPEHRGRVRVQLAAKFFERGLMPVRPKRSGESRYSRPSAFVRGVGGLVAGWLTSMSPTG